MKSDSTDVLGEFDVDHHSVSTELSNSMDLSCSKFEGEVLDMCSSTSIVPQLLRSLLVAGADAPHSSPVEAVSVSASAITVFGHGVGVLLWNSSCRAFLHSIEVSWGKSEVYII